MTTVEAISDKLLPCPFCDARLERGMHKMRNRDGGFAFMCVHPETESRCIADNVVVWAGERQSEDAWNRRADRLERQNRQMAEALHWYAAEAAAAKRYMADQRTNADALTAILTVLANDGGERARAALQQEGGS